MESTITIDVKQETGQPLIRINLPPNPQTTGDVRDKVLFNLFEQLGGIIPFVGITAPLGSSVTKELVPVTPEQICDWTHRFCVNRAETADQKERIKTLFQQILDTLNPPAKAVEADPEIVPVVKMPTRKKK